MNRRKLLKGLAAVPASVMSGGALTLTAVDAESGSRGTALRGYVPIKAVPDQPSNFDHSALTLLEEVRYRGAQFFLSFSHPESGLMLDRVRILEPAGRTTSISSIAATGFSLSALCVAAQHSYINPSQCEERLLTTLNFLLTRAEHERGFFPHYLDVSSGTAALASEYSSMDTAILLAGAIHAALFLNSRKAETYAEELYSRVDWSWMLGGDVDKVSTGTPALHMGWHPQTGFLQERWDAYSECLLMYLLAVGSPTHSIPARSWDAVRRSTFDYGGMRFISSYGALFIHQYLHIWADVRSVQDNYSNYFENSISAIHAHKTWCMLQHGRFPWVDERLWGFSASDSAGGAYQAWAAPPVVGVWDGTIAPHAAGGSLGLLPEESIVALKTIREHYPQSFTRYGFTNAFRPGMRQPEWFDPYAISGDLALIMLMAENQQTGSVRTTFQKNVHTSRAMEAVGFRKT